MKIFRANNDISSKLTLITFSLLWRWALLPNSSWPRQWTASFPTPGSSSHKCTFKGWAYIVSGGRSAHPHGFLHLLLQTPVQKSWAFSLSLWSKPRELSPVAESLCLGKRGALSSLTVLLCIVTFLLFSEFGNRSRKSDRKIVCVFLCRRCQECLC